MLEHPPAEQVLALLHHELGSPATLHVNMSETRTAFGSTEQGDGRTYHVEDRHHHSAAAAA
jgi:hypothetical protein